MKSIVLIGLIAALTACGPNTYVPQTDGEDRDPAPFVWTGFTHTHGEPQPEPEPEPVEPCRIGCAPWHDR